MATAFDFKAKHALLDTNILKAFLDTSKKAEMYKPVFEFLRDQEAFPYIISHITPFEFIGYSTNKRLYE
jgi:hypothetical protein